MTKRNGSEPILEVRNLQTHFFTDKGEVKAVNGVSLAWKTSRRWASSAKADVAKA